MNKLNRLFIATLFLPLLFSLAQQTQNPSPMVEHTRAHPRLKENHLPGRRETLELGTLFIPAKLKLKATTPLLIHFHGGTWLPEVAAARVNTAVISIQIGAGSGVYARAFAEANRLAKLLQEAEAKMGVKFAPLTLCGWSAGYGAIREILKVPDNYARVDRVLLIDGLHTGYVGAKPGPQESQLEKEGLQIFLQFARDAIAGKKRLLITHSEIFPGTFASTTETADWLLQQLGLKRKAVVRWGPMQTQQLSVVKQGGFHLVGFAGNSAPDHVDQLHSLPEYLRWLK
ncbi:MAG TPA: hypothetical protein VFZ34_24420 [Blastocatellia bacterium]|nr:hypothetical protein [Blastocatellia bacterium]